MSERIEAMMQFAAQFPDNPFPSYALAMEHKAAGDLEAAAQTLGELRLRLPAYVPTYLQLGTLLDQLGRAAQAREVLEAGVERARAAGDNHALGEIQGVLAGLD